MVFLSTSVAGWSSSSKNEIYFREMITAVIVCREVREQRGKGKSGDVRRNRRDVCRRATLGRHPASKHRRENKPIRSWFWFTVIESFCHLVPYTQSVVPPGSLSEMKKPTHPPGRTLRLPGLAAHCRAGCPVVRKRSAAYSAYSLTSTS